VIKVYVYILLAPNPLYLHNPNVTLSLNQIFMFLLLQKKYLISTNEITKDSSIYFELNDTYCVVKSQVMMSWCMVFLHKLLAPKSSLPHVGMVQVFAPLHLSSPHPCPSSTRPKPNGDTYQ